MTRSAIAAIPTAHGGVLFRSRLEARYAVLLDGIGVRWQYEAEGYNTSAGYYLPDLYLPSLNTWIEIKPEHPTTAEIERCRALAEGTTATVRLLYGPFAWWRDEPNETRAGGVGFWTEREGAIIHGFADTSHRYAPAVCDTCGAFGIPRAPDPVCSEAHRRALPEPIPAASLYLATRIAESYQFDGGR